MKTEQIYRHHSFETQVSIPPKLTKSDKKTFVFCLNIFLFILVNMNLESGSHYCKAQVQIPHPNLGSSWPASLVLTYDSVLRIDVWCVFFKTSITSLSSK